MGVTALNAVENSLHLDPLIRGQLKTILQMAVRRHNRVQVLWMASSLYAEAINIVYILPTDLSRNISHFL